MGSGQAWGEERKEHCRNGGKNESPKTGKRWLCSKSWGEASGSGVETSGKLSTTEVDGAMPL